MSVSEGDTKLGYLATNRKSWNKIASSTKGRTALPNYGPLCPNETELKLLGDLRGKSVVELGCGDGKSLAYLYSKGAEKLCGLDLAEEQIAGARSTCEQHGFAADLFCSPMEEDPGIEAGRFDLALSLYALGWSVDLDAALRLIVRYLKPGGVLVYSWEHPMFSCLKIRDKELIMNRSYSQVGPIQTLSWHKDPIVMQARKLSTFLNATIQSGLVLDEVIEGDMRPPAPGTDYPRRWYSQDRAQYMPTTLIIKAHKPA